MAGTMDPGNPLMSAIAANPAASLILALNVGVSLLALYALPWLTRPPIGLEALSKLVGALAAVGVAT